MRTSCALAVLLSWSCCAQHTPQSPKEVEAEMASHLHGLADRMEVPSRINIAPERPSAESISVYELHHKIPKAAQKSFERAQKKSKSGDYAGAVAELETAVRIDPLFAGAYNDLGIYYRYFGRVAEAKTAFERALELDPDSWKASYNLGLVVMQLGDLPGAAQNARRALQHASEQPLVHWLLGYVLCHEEATSAEGLEHVRYAARTIKEAKQLLDLLPAR